MAGWITESWSHFDFTSGANPYIAKTHAERDRVLANCAKCNFEVDELPYSSNESTQFFIVHDLEGARR